MDRRDIERKLKGLKLPEPDGDKKDLAINAAMSAFEEARSNRKKNVKGIDVDDRPKGKKWFKGGFVMNRPIIATAGVAALAMLITISIIPMSTKNGKVKVDVSNIMVKPEHQQKSYDENVSSPQAVGGKREIVENTRQDRDGETLSALRFRKEQSASGPIPKDMPAKSSLSQLAKGDLKNNEGDSLRASAPSIVAEAKVMSDEYRGNDQMGADPEMLAEEVAVSHAKPLSMAKAKKRPAGKMERVAGYVAQMPASDSFKYNLDGREYAGRDRFERKEQNPIKVVSEEPVSTFSIDVDTASYAFVRRALNNGNLPQKDSVRVEEMINYFDYNYDLPGSRKKPFKPTIALYPTPWNPATRLLHIGIKGHDLLQKKRPKANLVFLLDVSGSMSSPDKLPLLKKSLMMLVNELDPEDSVAIAVYAGAAGTVLEPTKVKDKGKILSSLERLQAGGSTAGGAGIKLAYSLAESNFDKDAVNRVILATDGDFNVGIRNSDELKGFVERKRETGVFLSVLGFGQGNYNDELMQKLAQNGNGNAAYIDTLSEARKVLVDEAASTLFTIARDVKIQVEFNPDRVAEYRLIGYETRMLKREDFNNDKVDAGDVGAGHSVTAIYEIIPAESRERYVDELRYGSKGKVKKGEKSGEYAFLKVRYKLPGEEESRLITTTVDDKYAYKKVSAVKDDIRFAAAVAAFGQVLKGGKYTQDYSYDKIIELARNARGEDRFGYRSEFLNIVRLAESASAMGER